MYKSFAQLYGDCQSLAVDTDTTTLALFKTWINEALTKAYAVLDAEHFLTTSTDLTVDGQGSYPLPYDCERLHSLKVSISSVDYVATEFPGSENAWISLNASTPEAAYPVYFYPKRNTYEIYPISSTDDYTMTLRYTRRRRDLTQADYTTGNIKTATNGSTAIVGNTGTAWTAIMADRFFKIDADYFWYEISSITDATNLVLAREYGGASIAAGTSSYTIGEMSLLPKAYQELPESYALWRYFKQKKMFDLANDYKKEWEEDLVAMASYASNSSTSGVLEEDISVPYMPDWPQDLA